MKKILVPLVYIAIVIVSISVFILTQIKIFLFLPFVFGLAGVLFFPRRIILNFILIYICFDGMIKILSGYTTVLHIASDILVVVIGIRRLLELATVTTERALRIPPFALIFGAHVLWVTVEILNPYGIGLIPGLAAYKVYLTFLLLYFYAYDFLESKSDFMQLVLVSLVLLSIQVVFSIYQFSIGTSSVLSLSGNYAKPIGEKFVGLWFRPFGTGAVPGIPSVWIFLTMPFIVAMFFENRKLLSRALLTVLMILSVYALVICQVRASLLKAFVSSVVASALINRYQPAKVFVGLVATLMIYGGLQVFTYISNPKMAIVQERLQTVYDFKKLTEARQGGVLLSIATTWIESPFGIGLSRVGAASGVFYDKIKENKFYGTEFAFADNLYKAIATELGIPGTILYLMFVGFPLGLVIRRIIYEEVPIDNLNFVSASVGLATASIAGYGGSEGALYLPECAYFWLFIGAAVRFSDPNYNQSPD
ncbi:MAG: hypothetical protein IPM57_11565 [Oligoflexia bacterium]|nr:hypothetical protein [Oligoflexia bacterium]